MMRVVIATDSFPAVSSALAGAAMGEAFADRGAEVAVVPIGAAGRGFSQAASDLLRAPVELMTVAGQVFTLTRQGGTSVLSVAGDPDLLPTRRIDRHSTSVVIGRAVALVLADSPDELVLEMPATTIHDGGAGLLAALGAVADKPLDAGVEGLRGITSVDLGAVRALVGRTRISLVVEADEVARHLVGLRGITSVRGHAAGVVSDPADLLALDQNLVDLAAACGSVESVSAGSGAGGGLGFACLLLGGRVLTGSQWCSEHSGLPTTAKAADLVVSGGGRLDFGSMGGEVLTHVTQVAGDALRPVVVVAGANFISARELRSVGVEAAYSVRPGADDVDTITVEEITEATRAVAASWTWPPLGGGPE
ncbi:glycerate kinase [Aestuariimicrobium sp. T2.26MG-19.2B]|uniref:glycerate kinase n=1 Tax=Aestuariimicrobium sp. T2.26MG-19.2B TaxID=3040679 RepID=UPI003145075A